MRRGWQKMSSWMRGSHVGNPALNGKLRGCCAQAIRVGSDSNRCSRILQLQAARSWPAGYMLLYFCRMHGKLCSSRPDQACRSLFCTRSNQRFSEVELA